MKKSFFFLVLLLFASFTLAQSFTEAVTSYSRQYENGEINLLQFNVLLTGEREKLFDSLAEPRLSVSTDSKRERDDMDREETGWNQAQMRSLFGEPTHQEQWAWSPIQRKSVKLQAPAPAWRKSIYEGPKLRVLIDGWPHAIESEGRLLIFYHFDVRPEFKQGSALNPSQMVQDFKALIEGANRNDEKVKQAAFKAVQVEREFQDHLTVNPLTCRDTLAQWFGQQGGLSNKLKWQATLHDGNVVTIKLSADEWTDAEWHGVSTWIELQHRTESFNNINNLQEEPTPYIFATFGEYVSKIREVLQELKRTGTNFDSSQSKSNYEHMQRLSNQYQQLVNELMNRVGRREIDVSNNEVIAELEKIFQEQSDFSKENVREFNFKQSLFNATKEVKSSYCSSNEASCGETQTCSKALCVESTCRDLQCSECQYQDRTTCTCVQVNNCVPQPREPERPPGEPEQPSENRTGNQQGSNSQSNQSSPGDRQGGQVQSNQTQPFAGGQNSTTTTQTRDSRDDGSCDCPPNPAPTCQPGYAAISQQYQHNSTSCSYAINCWRTTCEVDSTDVCWRTNTCGSNSNSSVTKSKISGLFSLPYACDNSCSANQYCAPEKGWCECKQGFRDCDGDWQNGCESAKECKQCQQDSDCAPARCSEDHGRVVQFQCKQGDSWTEQVASAEFGAGCAERNSGKIEPHAYLSAWGEGFEKFDYYKQQAWSTSDKTRCEAELQDLKKKRLELQSSLNDEFFTWFFENFVSKDPNDFEKQGRSIGAIYESFQRNSEDTARALRCLDRTDWPIEYKEVNAEIKTEFGKVRLWEEKKRTNYWETNQEIFSPYMKIWIFPTKEMFKRFFAEKIREEGPQGPSPEELAEIRNSPEAMDKIRKISGAFGGDARIIVQAVDGSESIVKFVFIVNEDDLIKIEPADTYNGSVSATVSVSLDFIYDVASSVAKDMEGEHLEVPHWEKQARPSTVVNDGVVVVKIFTRIFSGIVNGEISINPPSALPKIVFILQEMMTMIMSEGVSS